ncbi:MAG: hypothetical protein NZL93_01690, partial [Chthoniobacterales bacterium]|nr:hypothetical protein [Chthoniobacterales bacterium]
MAPIRHHEHRKILYRGLFFLTLLAAAVLYAAPPAWWTTRQVLDPSRPPDDYAVVNQGQAKAMAKKAFEEMQLRFAPWGGAGPTLTSLIQSWQTPSLTRDDYLALNVGQLKTLAAPFYDRLYELGWRINPAHPNRRYPWENLPTPAPTPDDYAVANVGQLKNLFALDFATIAASLPPPQSLSQQSSSSSWSSSSSSRNSSSQLSSLFSSQSRSSSASFSSSLSASPLPNATASSSFSHSHSRASSSSSSQFSFYISSQSSSHFSSVSHSSSSSSSSRAHSASSSSPPTLPVSDPYLWITAQISPTTAPNGAFTLPDLSGYDHHATQANPTHAPQRIQPQGASYHVLNFDGVDDHLTLAPGLSDFSEGLTAIVVARPTEARYARFFDFSNGMWQNNILFGHAWAHPNTALFYNVIRNGQDLPDRRLLTPSGHLTTDRLKIYTISASPIVTTNGTLAQATISVDGIPIATTTTQHPATITRTLNLIGKSAWSSEPTFRGHIAEIILFRRVLSSSETNLIHSHLMRRYYEDSDGDELPDVWELRYGLEPDNPGSAKDPEHGANGDPDGDGVTNIDEFENGTDPFQSDTDNDACLDSEEIQVGTNPLNADSSVSKNLFYNKFNREDLISEEGCMPISLFNIKQQEGWSDKMLSMLGDESSRIAFNYVESNLKTNIALSKGTIR